MPSCLTPHVPTQPGDAAVPPQSRRCLQQHLLSHRISRGPETRPARPGTLAVRNAPKPAGSQALQQHHGSVHALTSPKAAWSFLGILLGLKGGGGMLFIIKRHEGVPAVLNNTLMFHRANQERNQLMRNLCQPREMEIFLARNQGREHGKTSLISAM